MAPPELSIVTAVYNEEGSLVELHDRLKDVLAGAELAALEAEVIYVDDGSTDSSARLVLEIAANDPAVRLCSMGSNHGQFRALMAGLAQSCGRLVVTLDADLQNPPEEIPRVVAALQDEHDLVTTRRRARADPLPRRLASRLSNRISSWIAGTKVSDHGCMLCGYRDVLVERMCRDQGRYQFLHALAMRHARAPIDLEVDHSPRRHGKSRYGVLRLLALQMRAAAAFRRLRKDGVGREEFLDG